MTGELPEKYQSAVDVMLRIHAEIKNRALLLQNFYLRNDLIDLKDSFLRLKDSYSLASSNYSRLNDLYRELGNEAKSIKNERDILRTRKRSPLRTAAEPDSLRMAEKVLRDLSKQETGTKTRVGDEISRKKVIEKPDDEFVPLQLPRAPKKTKRVRKPEKKVVESENDSDIVKEIQLDLNLPPLEKPKTPRKRKRLLFMAETPEQRISHDSKRSKTVSGPLLGMFPKAK